jgi:hypothetical protein
MSEYNQKVQELYIEIAKTRNSITYIAEQVGKIAESTELCQAIFDAGGVDKLLYILGDKLEHLLEELSDEYSFKPNYSEITKDNL